MRASGSAFPCFEVTVVGLLRFRLGLIGRQTRSLAGEHLSAQGVDNVLARIQKRIEIKLRGVWILSLMELAEEEGALRDLPLCLFEHDLTPGRYKGAPEVIRLYNQFQTAAPHHVLRQWASGNRWTGERKISQPEAVSEKLFRHSESSMIRMSGTSSVYLVSPVHLVRFVQPKTRQTRQTK
jgi:hypothetical protein